MSNIQKIHVVRPLNNQSSYTEFTNIDFLLGFAGRKMVPNSVRLNGKLRVKVGAGQTNLKSADGDVFVDPNVGGHSWVDTVTVSTANQGTIESFTDYFRYKKLVSNCMATANDNLDSHSVCEMMAPNLDMMNDILQGEKIKGVAQADPNTQDASSFSIKLLCCLNQVSNLAPGAATVKSETTGDIRLSLRTSSNAALFFGKDCDANTSYEVTDLFLTFVSVPDDGSPQSPLLMRPKYSVKQTMQSNLSVFSSNAPVEAVSASVIYITQSEESNVKTNSCRLFRPPDVRRLDFYVNDNNSLLSYPLENQEEIVRYGLASVAEEFDNQASLTNLYANNAYVQGLNFGETIDLSRNSFQVRLESAINNTAPVTCQVLFHGRLMLQ